MNRLAPIPRGLIAVAVSLCILLSRPAISLWAQTPDPTATPTLTSAATVSPTRSPSPTVSPSSTPTPTPTPSGTPTPTETLEPTWTPLPTLTPLPTDTPAPTATSTPVPIFGFLSTSNLMPVLGGGLLLVVLVLLIVVLLRHRRRRRRHLQPTQPVPIVAPPVRVATLEFTDRAGNRVRFTLDKPVLTLGRASTNDLVVPDTIPNADTVSRAHAQFRRDQDNFIVRDLRSQNGLTVNGRHTNHNLLQDGDRIRFGNAEAVFRLSDRSAA